MRYGVTGDTLHASADWYVKGLEFINTCAPAKADKSSLLLMWTYLDWSYTALSADFIIISMMPTKWGGNGRSKCIIISMMPTKWGGNGRSKCYFMFWTDIDSLTFFSSKSDKSAFIYLLTATKHPPLSVMNSIATSLLFTIT